LSWVPADVVEYLILLVALKVPLAISITTTFIAHFGMVSDIEQPTWLKRDSRTDRLLFWALFLYQ